MHLQILDRIRKFGKGDWIILILVGVLLMVVAWPTGGSSSGNSTESGASSNGSSEDSISDDGGSSAVAANEAASDVGSSGNGASESQAYSDKWQIYAAALEDELTELLSHMAGVGEVKVMITLENNGETVLQKDSSKSDDSSSESTVILEQGDDELPYITSQVMPSVQGVVVVAQGAGSGNISTEITEAVMALFGIEAHKVKVLQM